MEREDAARMYEENEKLVYFVIAKYFPTRVGEEDIEQEGRIGLWSACLRYDPDKSAFSTYAVRAIKNAIMMYLRVETRQNKLPTVSLNSTVGQHKNGDEITVEDLIEGEPDIDFVDVNGFLSRLKEQEKRVVRMRSRGATLREIGEAEGLSGQSILLMLRRIRRKAHMELEEYE